MFIFRLYYNSLLFVNYLCHPLPLTRGMSSFSDRFYFSLEIVNNYLFVYTDKIYSIPDSHQPIVSTL